MKFDIESLNHIPIIDVLEKLGAIQERDKKIIHCFNITNHKNDDKNASMAIYEKTNSCHCFACGMSGKPVNLVKLILGDFKKACEYLHSAFNIPYLNGAKATLREEFLKQKTRSKNYFYFDENKDYVELSNLEPYLVKYHTLSQTQKLKLVYSFIYRFSLTTNQAKKKAYYLQRGIEKLSLVEDLGFLSYKDIKELESLLLKNFPLEDLRKFKVFHKEKEAWNYAFNVAVIPNFDLYSNLLTGFSLRAIDSTYKGVKEVNINCNDICPILPFNLTYAKLKLCEKVILCEGHIDALSGGQYYKQDGKALFVSFGGAFCIKEEVLTLLKGKKVFICFDKDEAGLRGQNALSKSLSLLEINHSILTWDNHLGKDLNDLLKANQMSSIKVSKE
ncbi:toprim domain-containing protein [Campylobacter upsaliensis]|nr:DNA primase [Campylobacter upsaliensis]ECH3659784.1 DNA primase [Campylobacter upsaliensis]EDC3761711.1 DNA primase [Campylobacter upsaliensis]EEA8807472.1 DNA primase [Campylobacter upsaliensis]EHD8285150.1 DNA primase [Campylobacter upsaliensis]